MDLWNSFSVLNNPVAIIYLVVSFLIRAIFLMSCSKCVGRFNMTLGYFVWMFYTLVLQLYHGTFSVRIHIQRSSLIYCFVVCGFSYLWSTVVRKKEMENSRNKQFLSFKLYIFPMKSHPILLHYTREANDPFVPHFCYRWRERDPSHETPSLASVHVSLARE